MVDVMLVLLIIFMVSAPLLTVGVPIDLPEITGQEPRPGQRTAHNFGHQWGKVFLQNTEIGVEELVPKLKAITECARAGDGGANLCARRPQGRLRYRDEGDGTALGGGFPSGCAGDGGRAGILIGRCGHEDGPHHIGGAHAGVLLWSVLTFAAQPYAGAAGRGAADRHHLHHRFHADDRRAPRTRPRAEKPKPVAEKVGEATPTPDPIAKLDKKEVKAATDTPPIRQAAEPEPEPKKQAEQQSRPDRRRAEEGRRQEARVRRRRRPRPRRRRSGRRCPRPPSIRDRCRRCSTSATRSGVAAAGETINNTVSLGTSNGTAAQLSQSELDALRRGLSECWNPPAGADAALRLQVVLRVLFNQDGTVARPPDLVAGDALAAWSGRSPTAPSARSCGASPSTCSNRSITSSGKTSRSPSIRAT